MRARVVAVTVAAGPLAAVVLLGAAGAAGGTAGGGPVTGGADGAAGGAGPAADIPPEMLALYRGAAATCPGLDWAVLAGIGRVETDHGRDTAISSAGAEGPMQFLPGTFAEYAVDVDGVGAPDINDPADAVYTAARMLCADGAGSAAGLSGAVYAYNHSIVYVADVLGWAATYESAYRAR